MLETEEAQLNRETVREFPSDPGRPQTALTSFYPIRVAGQVIGVGIHVLDITERKQAELEHKRLSERDSQTGLYNRHKLFAELQRIIKSANCDGDESALMLCKRPGSAAGVYYYCGRIGTLLGCASAPTTRRIGMSGIAARRRGISTSATAALKNRVN